MRFGDTLKTNPTFAQWRVQLTQWSKNSYIGMFVLFVGTALATLFIMAINSMVVIIPNPGLIYLPLVAMLAYHWGWRHAVIGAILQLICVYFFFIPPSNIVKPFTSESTAQLLTLAAVTGFMLLIVQLARTRRTMAEQGVSRFAALNRIGISLASELDEARLLHLIAETACNLTGAEFAAFTLRPIDELGQPLVPSEGNLFHLAAVVGVTKAQEELLRRMPLGGEGLLAPIFRHGVPVLVADALTVPRIHRSSNTQNAQKDTGASPKSEARDAAFAYAHGLAPKEVLRTLGVPRGHPIVRSFLGAPLLDRNGQVRGGLLLGHGKPDQFTSKDEALLVGMATQAAVALENARLYHEAQTQAQELDAIFESIADGVTLVDNHGKILRENATARHLRETLAKMPAGTDAPERLLHEPAAAALRGDVQPGTQVTITDGQQDTREYIVSSSPLRPPVTHSGPLLQSKAAVNDIQNTVAGAVVVWHDVTEAQRLLIERRAHAETDTRRALLQMVIDELPSSVYLVRGKDARLVLGNRAAAAVWGATWPQDQPMSDFLQTNSIRVFRTDGRPLAPEEFATLRAVQTGEAVRHHQEIIRHKDGTTLPVLVNAVALNSHIFDQSTDSDTDISSKEIEPLAIVVHQDVTALKEAERLKDDFIGIAAHELRNPLAGLKGFSQMLIRQTARGNGPELADWQKEAIEAIDQATNRLVALTEDLLDVTRLQAGRLELHTEPTDIVALTQRVVARLQVTTTSHTIAIHTTTDHVVACIDRQRIEQVLGNLVNNAIKYSPGGGPVDITIDEDQHAELVQLSIRDYGIGIPLHQQGHIFGRFIRADNAREHEISGTGLGLYLCRELIERHAGRIWFESIEGKGSTFYMALPLNMQ